MKKSKGFTLIELVVVIAILGILAAVALPRFINVTEDAHEAAVAGAGGALASAVSLVRAQWEVNRSRGVANPSVNVAGFGNNTVDVNANGWPVGTDDGANIGNAEDCRALWQNLLQGSAPTVAGNGSAYIATATGNQTCTYTYQADGANDLIVYDATVGEVRTQIVD